jgi:mannosyltransferase
VAGRDALAYPRRVSSDSAIAHRSPRRRAGGGVGFSGGARPVEISARTASICLLGLVALAAALRAYHLGRQGFWFDEANTALLVRFSPGKMLGLIPQSESTPPLYYCVAWVWVRVFGDTEAGLRSLSALAGVLVVPVAYLAGSRLLGGRRRAGLIAAALAASNPLLIWYSQEARSYELLVLLCGLSLLGFAAVREDPRPRVVAMWAIASALALATHYYATLVVVPEALWLLVQHRRRVAVVAGVVAVGVCGAALVPLAISQNGTGNDNWIGRSPLGLRLAQILPQLVIGPSVPDRGLLKPLGLALGAVALGLLGWWIAAGRRGQSLGGVAAATWVALGGFILALLLVAVGFDDIITRNLIGLWLPVALVVCAGLAAPAGRMAAVIGVAVTAALCVIGIIVTLGVARDPSLQRPDWRPVARALGHAPAPGRAILVQHYAYLLPLSLYLPRLHRLQGPVRVRELDVIAMSSPQQPLCWWGAACNLIPSALQRDYRIAGLRPVERRQIRQFSILRLVARRPIALTRAEVGAALHTTRLSHDVLIDQPG